MSRKNRDAVATVYAELFDDNGWRPVRLSVAGDDRKATGYSVVVSTLDGVDTASPSFRLTGDQAALLLAALSRVLST